MKRGTRGFLVERKGLTVWRNQDPTRQGHAREWETRRYTGPDMDNVAATRNTTRRGREDQNLSPTQAKKNEREYGRTT